MEEGQKYFSQNKLININKIIKVGKIIQNIKERQMFVYGYKPVYSLAILSDPDPIGDDKLTSLSELLEPKYQLDKKTKIKRKTNTDLNLEKIQSGLPIQFLDSIKSYGNIHFNKMSLKDRIKKLKEQYIPINNIETSNPIERNLDISTISTISRISSHSSNISETQTLKSEIIE